MNQLAEFYNDVLTLGDQSKFERKWAVKMVEAITTFWCIRKPNPTQGESENTAAWERTRKQMGEWIESRPNCLNFGDDGIMYDYQIPDPQVAEKIKEEFPPFLNTVSKFFTAPQIESATAFTAENFYTMAEPFSDLLNAALSKNPDDPHCKRIIEWIRQGTTPCNFQDNSHFFTLISMDDPEWTPGNSKVPMKGDRCLYSGRSRIDESNVETLQTCYKEHTDFTLTSILSTSTSVDMSHKNNAKCFIVIKIKPGWWNPQTGLLNEGCTCEFRAARVFSWEQEIIVFPGSRFRVVDSDESMGMPTFTLEPVKTTGASERAVHMGGDVPQALCRLCGLLAFHH